MLQKEGYETYTAIFYSSRLPRVLGAILAGVAFSQAGTLLQRVTDNPLASPSILGINAGAGFAVLLLLVCFPLAYAFLPLAAFLGGAACDRSHIGRGALGGDEPRRHRACGRRPLRPLSGGHLLPFRRRPRRALLLHRFFGRRAARREDGRPAPPRRPHPCLPCCKSAAFEKARAFLPRGYARGLFGRFGETGAAHEPYRGGGFGGGCRLLYGAHRVSSGSSCRTRRAPS